MEEGEVCDWQRVGVEAWRWGCHYLRLNGDSVCPVMDWCISASRPFTAQIGSSTMPIYNV